jgi:hypothetical protein
VGSVLDSKLFNGNFYFPDENGNFVSEKQRRIAEILNDYDPNLQLQWIPPGQRSQSDLAFRVVHMAPGRAPYLVLTASELDERLLARVFAADQQRAAQSPLSFVDNYNAALELSRAKEAEEARMNDHDLAASILRNRKSHYRHGGIDYERNRRS